MFRSLILFMTVVNVCACGAQNVSGVTSPFFSVFFYASGKTLDIHRADGSLLFQNVRCEYLVGDRIVPATLPEYSPVLQKRPFHDDVGTGECLDILFSSQMEHFSIRAEIKLYHHEALLTIRMEVENLSNHHQPLRELRPLVVDGHAGSGLYFGNDMEHIRLLSHGYSFLDCGELYKLKNQHFETISNWNVALFNTAKKQGMTIGALKHDNTETQLVVGHRPDSEPAAGQKSMVFRVICSTNKKHSAMMRYFKTDSRTFLPTGWGRDYEKDGWLPDTVNVHHDYRLAPGARLSTGPVAVITAERPHRTLEYWAALNRILNKIQLPRTLPAGWCSWPDMYYNINETKILRIADFAAGQYLQDFGFSVIQIDDGFQRQWGDWEGNLYFPRGMKWLAEEIQKRGFTPGIWLAPYAISINHKLVSQNPELLYQEPAGGFRTLTYYIGIPVYGLDISLPRSQEWVKSLFQRFSGRGYKFFKLDYIYDTVLNAKQFADPHLTKSQVYRRGLRNIRTAAGDRAWILECGALSAAGLCDSWRINADIGASWFELVKVRGTGRAVAKRYYLHGRLFHNDPDHLVVRDPLTLDQARVLATNVALSGGQVLAGDELYNLPAERLGIIKKVLPPCGKAATPLDLFEKQMPEIFVRKIKRDFEEWWMLTVINWQNTPAEKTITLNWPDFDPDAQYSAFEFWEQSFLGLVRRQISLKLAPTSVKVIALRTVTKHPQIIGTDRHITQGGIELDGIAFDKDSQVLTGRFYGARTHDFNLILYTPGKLEIEKAEAGGASVSVQRTSPDLSKIVFHFKDKTADFNIVFGDGP